MKKMPTLFVRDFEATPSYVKWGEINPKADWVIDERQGESLLWVARDVTVTRKIDGTCMMFDGELWWARRQVRPGRNEPDSFLLLETDPITEIKVGWEHAESSSWHTQLTEALSAGEYAGEYMGTPFRLGTYELIGPTINRNPENLPTHHLVAHDSETLVLDWLSSSSVTLAMMLCHWRGWEGVVFHHLDGRRAKLKVRDIDWMNFGDGSQIDVTHIPCPADTYRRVHHLVPKANGQTAQKETSYIRACTYCGKSEADLRAGK